MIKALKFDKPQSPELPYKREFTEEEREFMFENFKNYGFSNIDTNGIIFLNNGEFDSSQEILARYYITEDMLKEVMEK